MIDRSVYGWYSNLGGSRSEVIDQISEIFTQVPEKYRASAELWPEYDYDDKYKIVWQSPETKEDIEKEKLARVATEHLRRQQYEELKKEFG
jgi:hypothetical protein